MDEGDLGRSLLDAFATIPDPRIAKGRRHPLPAILALATAAMLSGARSLYAIAQWGRLQDPSVLHALGFTRDTTPAVSTLHLVFRRIETTAFEAALQDWAQQNLGERGATIAIDGKGLRGSTARNCRGCGWLPPMPMTPAWCWRKRGVRTDEHEAELTLAPAVLAALPLEGRLVTGDALYCQRAVCQQILDGGGEYLVIVKANQEKLSDAVALLFAEPPETFSRAQQVEQHGDRVEVRRIEVSSALAGYLEWPGAAQVCWVERTTRQKGRILRESRYAITSRSRDPAHLLQRVRGHWAIEMA